MRQILVICNSHHSKSVIGLAEDIARLEPTVTVIAVCEKGDVARYQAEVDPQFTKVISWQDQSKIQADSPTAGFVASQSEGRLLKRCYRWAARLSAQNNSTIVRFLIDVAKYSSLGCLIREKAYGLHLQSQKVMVDALFDQVQPSVVFAFGDRHIDFEVPSLVVARERGIKVVLPYVTYSGSSGLIKVRKIEKSFGVFERLSLYRLYAAVRFRPQIREACFWQQPPILFALHRFKALPRNPWCVGSGLSDIVCVDNAKTLARYRDEGVAQSKLRIMGDATFDHLFVGCANRDETISRLTREGLIEPGTPVVIVALPQFMEQGVMDAERHLAAIHSILRDVTRSVANVIVSLHPRVNLANYAFIESTYSARISPYGLKDILPAANLFIAANSSTVFWATLCGVPSLVLGYFDLDCSMFASFKSVTLVRHREGLASAISAALSCGPPDFTRDWEQLSRREVFDGRVLQRYRNLVLEICE